MNLAIIKKKNEEREREYGPLCIKGLNVLPME